MWHFLPELSPPFRQEHAFSVTQVASFLLNNGVPYDECLNNTPTPLTEEVPGDKSHLVAVPCWSKLLWDQLGHCPNLWQTLPHPGTAPRWPNTELQPLPSEGWWKAEPLPARCTLWGSAPYTLPAPWDSTVTNTSGGTRLQ